VTQGSLKVKLVPPKSARYLYPVKDYENLEFRSQINPWNPQPKFRADFDKVKCLEIVLTPGTFLFIPSYWWYSFKFDENTSVSSFKYRTYMNNIAISPHIFMYALQNQNVEHKIAKQIDIKGLNQGQKNGETTNISELAFLSEVKEGEAKSGEVTSISELNVNKDEFIANENGVTSNINELTNANVIGENDTIIKENESINANQFVSAI
jgi:hypothetical protein